MKKIIVLMLVLALCVTAITSCGKKNNPKKILQEVTEMYDNSAPTKVVATTKQVFSAYELNCKYELTTGQVGGATASVYKVTKEELETIENAGGSDIVRPMIKTTTKVTEAIEGIGSRVDGSAWSAEGTVYTIGRGAMALTLDKETVTDVVYENSVLTFTIPNANIATVLGEAYATGVDGDISVTIVNDGSVITSIELRYTVPADTKAGLEASQMIVYVEYQYDIQQITIV